MTVQDSSDNADPTDPLAEAKASLDGLRTFLTQLGSWLTNNAPTILDIAQQFLEIPAKSGAAMLRMAEYGWYLHAGMALPDILHIAARLDAEDGPAVELEMCDGVDEGIEKIEKDIVGRYPHRKAAISAAFRAHKRGEYYLSTPVLLAQADGITQEVLGEQLYSRTNGLPKIARLYERFPPESDARRLLTAIFELTPLIHNDRERTSTGVALNRHAILHGVSSDYGRREISARAVTLLSFVSWAINQNAGDE